MSSDDDDDDDDEAMEAALFAEMEQAAASPHKRPRTTGSVGSQAQIKVAPGVTRRDQEVASTSDVAEASASAAGWIVAQGNETDNSEYDDGDGDEAAGYMWGMNIVTGQTLEQDKAQRQGHGERASQKEKPLVELRYGTYQGLQLSAAEVRRIKAEEGEAMLTRRKLVSTSACTCQRSRLPQPFAASFICHAHGGPSLPPPHPQGLVLDLDHTLLNSAMFGELDEGMQLACDAWARKERGLPPRPDPAEADSAGGSDANEAAAASSSSGGNDASASNGGNDNGGDGGPTALLYHLPHIGMWTKLRPHVREFLAGASKLFEMHVYTMGARAYAAEMVHLLDPTGSLGLHRDRVICKDDADRAHKDLDVMLGSENTAIIIDDTAAVWRQAGQLLVPRRYHFFPSSAARDGNLPPGHQAHLVAGRDEDGVGGQLHALLQALERIHAHYFARLDAQRGSASGSSAALGPSKPPHIADSVRAVRRGVLHGVTLVFSRVIPLKQDPKSHRAHRLACELGAAVVSNVGPHVTHVVAGADGTDKVRWARQQAKVHAVSVVWLDSCNFLWRRAEESAMPIEDGLAGSDADQASKLQEQKGTLAPPSLQ